MVKKIFSIIIVSAIRVVWLLCLLYFILFLFYNLWAYGVDNNPLFIKRAIFSSLMTVFTIAIFIIFKQYFMRKNNKRKHLVHKDDERS
jgi:heme/copper-type cytochrome/quinol oxidase subunit 2